MTTQRPDTSFLHRYWRISRGFSRPYLWAQIAVFLAYFSSNVGNLYVLDFSKIPGGVLLQLAKGFVDAAIFVLCSHFLLRGFLRDQIVPKSMNFVNGPALVVLVLLCSVLSVFVNIKVGDFTSLEAGQPESITFVVGDEEHEVNFGSPFVWGIATINQFVYFTIWSLAYIFWHASLSKRELKRQMQEARIQQLTNQLNPHFLFNALNSIRALIFEDKEKAAELVTQLSELFRTHLHAHLQPTASLSEEWAVAQQYLDIERVRLEERLSLSADISEDVTSQKLPTLTLLTLVENAIKHGVAPNAQRGNIHLAAHKVTPQRWQLVLTNSVGTKQDSEGTGTGLKNTVQRLQLMFGENASLTQRGSQGEFSVVLELPYV